ncbi:MAG: hypothetical protein LBU99_07405 [Spirochaetaceae bacterium]|jgi:hypothetical protein|nr:hypothetical protein [Spirochaetaceae bacterium]
MANFFPDREAEFLVWLENFSAVLTANAAVWDIPAKAADDLANQVNAYAAVYKKAKGEDGTKALIVEKNEKQKGVIEKVRRIKNRYIDPHDGVTNSDRERLGLPLRGRVSSAKTKPKSRPVLEVTPTNHLQHTVTVLNQISGTKKKPEDAYGICTVWDIRDSAPESADELRHPTFKRKATEVINFEACDRGKRVFYAACYQNAKGEKGPWSVIVEMGIP